MKLYAIATILFALLAITASSVLAGSTAEKLRSIVIPAVTLEDASIQAVVEFLREESRKLDPDHEGVNFLLHPSLAAKQTTARGGITLNFGRMPLGEVVRYVCLAAGLEYKIDDNAVIIADRGVPLDRMETRFYSVNAGVLDTTPTRQAQPIKDPGN